MSGLFDWQGNGLLFLLGGTVTSLFAPCASLFASLCAPRASFLTSSVRPCVVPDAVPYQTSAFQWTAWRAWWAASGLQPVSPSELQARQQVQTQPRIQKEQERFDDRPASVPNVHPCQAPGLLPSRTSHKFQRVGIDPNQPGRWQQSVSRTAIGSGGRCLSSARRYEGRPVIAREDFSLTDLSDLTQDHLVVGRKSGRPGREKLAGKHAFSCDAVLYRRRNNSIIRESNVPALGGQSIGTHHD